MSKSSSTEQDEYVSISEFEAWLQGVEDMQDDDWIPSDKQWKKIRSKINKLCKSANMSNVKSEPGGKYSNSINAPEATNSGALDVPHQGIQQSSLLINDVPPEQHSPTRFNPIMDDNALVETPDLEASALYKSTFE